MDLRDAIRGRRAASSGAGRELRERCGLPLRVFADELGVTPTTLWQWERAIRVPTPEHAAAYARLLARIEAELATC